MGVKEFYEEMYGDGKSTNAKPSLYSYVMEHTLGKLLTDRYRLCYQALPDGDSILDIGCGDDLGLMPLWEKYRQVYGIDISRPRIDRMQKQFGDRTSIHLSVQDIDQGLNFADGLFDTIICIHVLEHIFDPYHFMKECHRLLKIRGTLIVGVPNIAWIGNRIRLLLGRFPGVAGGAGGAAHDRGEAWDGGHIHFFTVASLKKLFQREGFEVTRIAYDGPSRRFWGSLLSVGILMIGTKK